MARFRTQSQRNQLDKTEDAGQLLSRLEIANPPSGIRCPLLELPLEIRIMIYEYVLENAGLAALDYFNPWANDFVGVEQDGSFPVYGRSNIQIGEMLFKTHSTDWTLTQSSVPLRIVIPGFVSEENTDLQLYAERNVYYGGLMPSLRHSYHIEHDAVPVYPHRFVNSLEYRLCEANARPDAALVFVCRQTSKEFSTILYSKTIFAMASSRTIRKFMMEPKGTAQQATLLRFQMGPSSQIGLSFVRELCLQCKRSTKQDGILHRSVKAQQDKYYDNWRTSCLSMVTQLTSLNNLALFIEVPGDEDAILSLETDWITPFLQFSQSKSLKLVCVSLNASERFSSLAPLRAFAEVIRRKILGWDDSQALAAITDATKEFPVGFGGQRLEDEWEQLWAWNKTDV